MQKLPSVIKSALIAVLATLMIGLSPAAVYAETAEECVPPTASGAGNHRPSGADAAAYTYNCDSGVWESSRYIYYPSTGQIVAKDPTVYTYSTSSGKWDYTIWVYNAPSASYIAWVRSVDTPPAGAQTVGGPPPPPPPVSTPIPGSSRAQAGNNPSSNKSSSSITNDNISRIANLFRTSSLSGSAGVNQNTAAGSASTGDAEAIANIINVLQSVNNVFGESSDLVTFLSNIDGDVFGDLFIDPSLLISAIGSSINGMPDDVTFNQSSQNEINNDIDLDSRSGDAQVSENTTAGDATTGSAKAVANIVNIINSAITSGKSFLGVVNINGNLNGDILLPANFVEQLLAANVPTTTINTSKVNGGSTLKANINTNTGINNNLNANASTGQANVDSNTSAGNAITGNASTNITAFNLTGSNTIGKNSILVFVNVMGEWVGMIVNAPAGSTAAQLGGGVTQNSLLGTNSNLNANTNNQINNNVNVNANSGNAYVSRNTSAGDARTGDANAAINLLNIASSDMSFSDWFGILFINVFGTWNGSFGIDTEAGNRPVASPAPTQPFSAQVFRFAPAQSASGSSANASATGVGTIVEQLTTAEAAPDDAQTTVLGSTTGAPTQSAPQTPIDSFLSRWTVPFLFSGTLGLILLAVERIASIRRQRLASSSPLKV